MIAVAYGLLVVAAALFFIRVLRGPSLADRIVAIDAVIVAGAAMIVVHAVDTGDGSLLPVVVIFTLVGFIGTAVVARFIEARGR